MGEKSQATSVPSTAGDIRAVDAAINRVLLRERSAREAIAECQRRAEAILAAGREQARAVELRGEARETALHRLCDRRVEERVNALLRQVPPTAEALSSAQQARLDQVIATLCDEMIGGPP